MKKKRIHTKVRVVLVLTVILTVALALLSSIGQGDSFPQRVANGIMAPLRSGVDGLVSQAEELYGHFFRYDALLAENQALKDQIAEMENDARTADSLRRENQRLKDLAGLKEEREDFELVSAYIITWDSNDWTSSFILNKGTAAGIQKDMVVITAQGQVVGVVTSAGTSWCSVTTVLDSSLEISANISSSGYAGMVQGAYTRGDAGMLRMNYLPADAVVRNSDQVVTAGSTLYPRDLILGYVAGAGFDETGVAKYALLEPAADFDSLEQVFVLTNYINE